MAGGKGLHKTLLRHFLLLSLAPLSMVGGVSYVLASRSLETRITEYLKEQAHQLSGAVDRMLLKAGADVVTWAQLSVFKGALLFDSYEKSGQYLRDFKEAYPLYHAIHLYDRDGRRVASSSSDADTAVASEDLDRVLSGSPAISGVRKTDSGFRIVFGAPVTTASDETVSGAIIAELDWGNVLQLLQEAEEHARRNGRQSYRVLLIDEGGRIVADQAHDRILLGSLPVEGVVQTALAGQRGSGYESFDEDVELLVGYAPLTSLGAGKARRGACLVAESAGEALSPVRQLGWALLAIALGATGAAFGFSRSLARRVVHPVEAASEQARAIARGELSGNLDVPARDELRDLITSLNTMSEELRRVAELANEISMGKLPEALSPRSEKDRLRHSLQNMTRYVQRMAALAERIADGDLTVAEQTVSDEDVLGRAFQRMTKNLHELLGQVQALANHSASASAEIAASAEQTARMGEQATSSAERLMETMRQMSQSIGRIAGGKGHEQGSSLDQVSASINSTAESIERLALVAREAAHSTDSGRKAMAAASEGMSEIRTAMTGAAETVQALGARAANIGQIVAIIEDIAEQTNLLALNAAIEAARAGEHGAGFAVVAEEVRKLAERSATSASEISDLIRDIDARVSSAVGIMTTSNTSVEEGMRRSGEVANALQAIDQVVSELNALIADIESATSVQSGGAEQIADSARRIREGTVDVMTTSKAMKDIVMENASSASRLAESAQSLSDQVDRLHQLLSRFKLTQ